MAHGDDSGDESLTFRIAAVFFVLLAGAAGVFTPYLVRIITHSATAGLPYRARIALKLFGALGSGVVLSTAMLHILPDGREVLTRGISESHGPGAKEDDYPYPELITMLALGVVFFIERELAVALHHREKWAARHIVDDENAALTDTHPPRYGSAGSSPSPAHADGEAPSCRHTMDEAGVIGAGTLQHAATVETKRLMHARLKLHIMEVAIAVHSVLIGLSVGALSDLGAARTLAVAIVVHQFCEGVALGAVIVSAGVERRHAAMLMGLFALTAPAGVSLGIGLERAFGSDHSARADIAEGSLSSAAAGVLLYMALCDMFPHLREPVPKKLPAAVEALQEPLVLPSEAPADDSRPSFASPTVIAHTVELEEAGDDEQPLLLRLAIMSAVAVGAGIMAVLAKWG